MSVDRGFTAPRHHRTRTVVAQPTGNLFRVRWSYPNAVHANGSNTRPQRSSGNSRMSRDELLKRFDANRNGRIDGEEMQKVRAMSGRSDRDSVQPTAPKEGRLDRDELMKRFDLDDNGRLDAAERKQAFEAMRKKKVQ